MSLPAGNGYENAEFSIRHGEVADTWESNTSPAPLWRSTGLLGQKELAAAWSESRWLPH